MKTVVKCARCRRRWRGGDDWNCTWKGGRPTGEFLCPDCQTPEEHIEAQVNEATLDYTNATFDEAGRWYVKPKHGRTINAELNG